MGFQVCKSASVKCKWEIPVDAMSSIAGVKPVALSECDIIPNPDVMKGKRFMWNWFTTWHGRWLRKNDPDYLKRVYNHQLVITQDELPDWK